MQGVAGVRRERGAQVLPWIGTAARVVLGGVWVVAGLVKLPDPAAAERAVRAYQLAPEGLVPVLAFGLPVLEIAIGVLAAAVVQAGSSAATTPPADPGFWAGMYAGDVATFAGAIATMLVGIITAVIAVKTYKTQQKETRW